MAGALVASAAGLIALAAQIEATPPPVVVAPPSAYDLLPTSVAWDCLPEDLETVRGRIGRIKRQLTLDQTSAEMPSTTDMKAVERFLHAHATDVALAEWRRSEIATEQAALARCGQSVDVDICAGFDPQMIEDSVEYLRREDGQRWLRPGIREHLMRLHAERELCRSR